MILEVEEGIASKMTYTTFAPVTYEFVSTDLKGKGALLYITKSK